MLDFRHSPAAVSPHHYLLLPISPLPGRGRDLHGEPGAVLQEVLRFHHHYLVVVSRRDGGTEAQLKEERGRPLFLSVGCHALQLNIKKKKIHHPFTFNLSSVFVYLLMCYFWMIRVFLCSYGRYCGLLAFIAFYLTFATLYPFTPACLSFPFSRLDGTNGGGVEGWSPAESKAPVVGRCCGGGERLKKKAR